MAARAPQPKIVTAEDRCAHRLHVTLDLIQERDRIAVQAWYRRHPEEMREELDLWNTRAAERQAEHREAREERRQDRLASEADGAAGRT